MAIRNGLTVLLATTVLSFIMANRATATMVTANFVTPNATRMVFMVNFDISSVICQKSANPEDLAIYPISALCDGTRQCLEAPNMDDESFPFCSHTCNPPCGPRGTCLVDGGKAQCYCDQGYSGKSCAVEATNECAKKPCHWLAKCTNTYGSYYCSCLPGFSGDGRNCTDIDECAVHSIAKKCPPHSECTNVPGSYFCNCTQGYRPRGTPVDICDDIDECKEKLDNCTTGTACVNTKGSYKCVPSQNEATNCTGGYEIRNGKCVDIDECKKSDACSPRATCTNTKGGYHCACPAGFTGDGKSCTPLVDCSVNPDICHPNAFCVSDLKMCLCHSGYIGDGISCFDMNECASDHPPCSPFEKCINTNGSHVCCPAGSSESACLEAHAKTQCPQGCGKHAECVSGQCSCKLGFVGNPAIGCTDVDECKENPCTAGQWCVNFDGGHVCCYHGAPVSRCQGLVIGIWNKTGKGKKKHNTTASSVLLNSTAAASTPLSSPLITSPTSPVTSPITSSPIASSTGSTTEDAGAVPTVAGLQPPNPDGCSPSQAKYCELKSNKTCAIVDGHPDCIDCLSGFSLVGGECITLDGGASGSDCRNSKKNDCHQHATCLDLSPSGHLCACKDGFIGDGRRCDDVDECYTPNLCSPNATCINQIGSFKCVCKSGFAGDGRFCTAVCPGGGFPHLTSGPCSQEADKCPSGFVCQGQHCCPLADVALNCEANPAICGDNAKCVERQCVCDSGFTRNGSHCQDMNECNETEPVCEKNQKCFNLPGNFACCPGKSAQDKELCASLQANITDCRVNHTSCHPSAECNTTDGSCYCTPGYLGDGRQCHPDPDDCFIHLGLCDLTSSRCVDRRCRCLDGFDGNGTACKATTCETQPSICHRNAECLKGGQCACKDGFVGNGINCVPDPNDCEAWTHLCHANATCQTRRCHCNDGFRGDGKTCTPIDRSNCQLSPSICGDNAFCNQTRCHCKLGYLGDGEKGCRADPEDCVLSPSRCPPPPSAECVDRRCKCAKGYVGNGTTCSVDLEDCEVGGLICHTNAKCVDRKHCQCSDGFEGDGVKTCERAEIDCQANNAICHSNAQCRQVSAGNAYGIGAQWRCKCAEGYEGNGRQCTESSKVTPVFDPRPNGTTSGQHSSTSTGRSEGTSTFGSSTPSTVASSGSGGLVLGGGANDTDTRDRIDVECQDDGILLLYVDKSGDGTSRNFNGRIFVKTQSLNPYCSKDFASGDGPVYKFKAPFAFCDVKAEPHNTFSVVVVIQKHPLFVTEQDEAYNLRCTYPVGEVPLMSHFNVSMLATAGYYVNNGTMPQCELKVLAQEASSASASSTAANPYGIKADDTNTKWREISEAIVGQKVQLQLNVEPKSLYGLIAKNCMAVNMDSGESYQLTNTRGCAVDTTIFPEWNQDSNDQLSAKFLTFKWPDTAHVRFQCDCSPCFEKCEPVQCGANNGWGRRKRAITVESAADTADESQTTNAVFSSVLRIRDTGGMDDLDWQDDTDAEIESQSQSNQTVWLVNDPYEFADEEDVCIHSVVFASALGLAISLAISVFAVGLGGWRSYRRNRSPSPSVRSVESSSSESTVPSFKYWSPSSWVSGGRFVTTPSMMTACDAYRSDATLFRR